MYLCIDKGNSRTKTAIFSQRGELVSVSAFIDDDIQKIKEIVSGYPVRNAIISFTGKKEWEPDDLGIDGAIELNHSMPLPVEIVYSTPETLGRDRIAAACGAHALFPGMNCMIVDAGTCITMDILSARGVFLGGNIAPGIEMRLNAMHEKTARLPLVEPGFPNQFLGDSTVHALQNGACLGAIMEMEGLWNRARNAYGDVFTVITGGDASLLAARWEYQIFAEPDLVMHGLYQILALNVKNLP